MMLSVIKPRTSSSNRDPWVTACKARIKSNEAELLELLDEKQQEAYISYYPASPIPMTNWKQCRACRAIQGRDTFTHCLNPASRSTYSKDYTSTQQAVRQSRRCTRQNVTRSAYLHNPLALNLHYTTRDIQDSYCADRRPFFTRGPRS